MSHPLVAIHASRQSAPEFINPWGMFVGVFVPLWLLARREISSGAKLCYATLAFAAGRDGVCSLGQRALAERLGCSERTVRRYLNELVAHRLVDERREDWGRPLVYRFFAHEWMSGFRHPELVPVLPQPPIPDTSGRTAPDTSVRSTNKEEKKTKTTAPAIEPDLFTGSRGPETAEGAAAVRAAPGEGNAPDALLVAEGIDPGVARRATVGRTEADVRAAIAGADALARAGKLKRRRGYIIAALRDRYDPVQLKPDRPRADPAALAAEAARAAAARANEASRVRDQGETVERAVAALTPAEWQRHLDAVLPTLNAVALRQMARARSPRDVLLVRLAVFDRLAPAAPA